MCRDIISTPCWVEIGSLQVHGNPEECEDYDPEPPEPSEDEIKKGQKGELEDNEVIKGHWNMRLTSFQKLVFIKAFKEEKVRN